MSNAPRSRAPQRRSVETRERLVEAAVREFAERGFDGASTRAIAKRAEAAQSALAYHFTTKDALWRAAADRVFALIGDRFRRRIEGLEGVDAPTRARLMLGDFVRFAAAHPEMHRFMLQEGTGPSERLDWLVATHVRPLIAFVADAVADLEAAGHPLTGRPDHLFYMMIGAVATPYALAPEFQLTTGEDPFSEPMIEAHIAAVLRLFFPDQRGDVG